MLGVSESSPVTYSGLGARLLCMPGFLGPAPNAPVSIQVPDRVVLVMGVQREVPMVSPAGISAGLEGLKRAQARAFQLSGQQQLGLRDCGLPFSSDWPLLPVFPPLGVFCCGTRAPAPLDPERRMCRPRAQHWLMMALSVSLVLVHHSVAHLCGAQGLGQPTIEQSRDPGVPPWSTWLWHIIPRNTVGTVGAFMSIARMVRHSREPARAGQFGALTHIGDLVCHPLEPHIAHCYKWRAGAGSAHPQ